MVVAISEKRCGFYAHLYQQNNYNEAVDLDRRRYTSGYVFNLFGGAISWMRKRQDVLALSTIKAKYMASTHAISMATQIVFKYWVSTTRSEIRL